jgi:hypothetical protein
VPSFRTSVRIERSESILTLNRSRTAMLGPEEVLFGAGDDSTSTAWAPMGRDVQLMVSKDRNRPPSSRKFRLPGSPDRSFQCKGFRIGWSNATTLDSSTLDMSNSRYSLPNSSLDSIGLFRIHPISQCCSVSYPITPQESYPSGQRLLRHRGGESCLTPAIQCPPFLRPVRIVDLNISEKNRRSGSLI